MKNICNRYLIVTVLFLVSWSFGSAYSYNKHYEELQQTLFGINTDKRTNTDKISKKGYVNFDLLIRASRLTLDYYNDDLYGAKDILLLKNHGVKNLPPIDSIKYESYPNEHQMFTHLGWEYNYKPDKANWPARKRILLSTVEKIGEFKKNEHIKLDAFAGLVYDIHILGDHCGDSEATRLTRIRLVSEHDHKGQIVSPTSDGPFKYPTLFVYLLYHIQRLFREQQDSFEYKQLIGFLNRNKDKFINDNPLNYEDVKKLAEETMEQLIMYLPKLLERERFFKEAFLIN